MQDTGSTLARRIADAATRLSLDGLPRASQDRLRWSVLDFLGCAIGGAALPDVGPALVLAGSGEVHIPGFDQGFDMASAAMVFGTAGTLFQIHDVYLPGHIHSSSPVVPAAWVAWQRQGGPVESFLEAVLAGYETLNRLSATTYPRQQKAGSTPTATLGALGAAVAAGRMAGLTGESLARAIGNAAMLAPLTPFQALREHGSAVPLHSGAAARAGVEAVLLAERGWAAGQCVLEGTDGFPGWLAVIEGDPSVLRPEQWDGRSVDDMIWKLMPACFASLPAVEAALRLPRMDVGRIESVEIRMPGAPMTLVGEGPSRHEPELYDRLMSVRWSVAQVLLNGTYGPAMAMKSPPAHAMLEALLAKITVRHSPELDSALPAAVATTIRVELADGSAHEVIHSRKPALDLADGLPYAWISTPDAQLLAAKFATLTAHRATEAQSLRRTLFPD
jgi:2-methylcitrate dehydratase PrpD